MLNAYVNLDCAPDRFAALTGQITRILETEDSVVPDAEKVDAGGAVLNLFTSRRGIRSTATRVDTLSRCRRILRERLAASDGATIASVRVIECVEDGDARPVDLTMLSDILVLIAELVSEEIPCEAHDLIYARTGSSPFAAGFEITEVKPMFSLDAAAEAMSELLAILDGSGMTIDMDALRDSDPEMAARITAQGDAFREELERMFAPDAVH